MNDLKPDINHVQFENTGKEVTARIRGTSLWFVYNVSIQFTNGERRDLTVDVTKSLECELHAIMQEKHLDDLQTVGARVKTHFHNSEYLPLQTKFTAKTTVSIVILHVYSFNRLFVVFALFRKSFFS